MQGKVVSVVQVDDWTTVSRASTCVKKVTSWCTASTPAPRSRSNTTHIIVRESDFLV